MLLYGWLCYEYYERRTTKMKTFETPYIDVIKFAVSDVITVSEGEEDEDMPTPIAPCL